MSTKKKVIHFSVWAKTFTQFRIELLNELKNLGYENLILCSYENYHVDYLKNQGYQIKTYDYSKHLDTKIFASIRNLKKTVSQEMPCTVIMHQPMALLIGVLALSNKNIKLLYSTGGLKTNESMSPITKLFNWVVEKWLLSKCDLILNVNQEDNQKLQPILGKKSVYVGPRGGCGINTNKFKFYADFREEKRKNLSIGSDDIVIGFVGRIEKEKGIYELINLFNEINGEYKTIFLVILGAGSETDNLNAYLRELNNPNIQYLGRKEDIEFWYSLFDLFILNSKREGMPTSLLEAMASNCIVLTTPVRGAREVVVHKENGIIYNEINELKSILLDIIKNYPFYAKFKPRAEETIVKNYSTSALMPKTIEAYQKYI